MARGVKNPTNIHEDADFTPGLAQWVNDLALLLIAHIVRWWFCDIGLNCSSDSTRSLGTSICHSCSPKNKNKNKMDELCHMGIKSQ